MHIEKVFPILMSAN